MNKFNKIIDLYLSIISVLWDKGYIRNYKTIPPNTAQRLYTKPSPRLGTRGGFQVMVGDLTLKLSNGVLYLPELDTTLVCWLNDLRIHPASPTGIMVQEHLSQINQCMGNTVRSVSTI